MITKHKEHQCKECQMQLPLFVDLLAQIAKQHFKEQSEVRRKTV